AVIDKANDKLLKERLERLRRIDHDEFIRRAARQAPESAVRAEALARIDSPGFLGDCAIAESDHQLALSLIERIDRISTLERMHDALRRRNKRRTQAVAERLDALQAGSGQHDLGAATAARLVERAERLARGEHDEPPRTELEALEIAWQACHKPPAALERRFSGALAIARRALEAPRREPRAQTQDAQPAADTVPEEDAANQQLSAVVERLEALPDPPEIDSDQAAGLLGHLDRAWL